MQSVISLNHFYYIRNFTDMCYKYHRVLSIIREQLHRESVDGDVFIVMSRNRRTVQCLLLIIILVVYLKRRLYHPINS